MAMSHAPAWHGAQPVNAHECGERATRKAATHGRGRNGSEYATLETAIHAPTRQAQWRQIRVAPLATPGRVAHRPILRLRIVEEYLPTSLSGSQARWASAMWRAM